VDEDLDEQGDAGGEEREGRRAPRTRSGIE